VVGERREMAALLELRLPSGPAHLDWLEDGMESGAGVGRGFESVQGVWICEKRTLQRWEPFCAFWALIAFA